MSNWPDPGCQMMDMTHNYSLYCMTYVKNMSNWPELGCQMMDMTHNYSLYCIKVIFLEKLKTIKEDEYA